MLSTATEEMIMMVDSVKSLGAKVPHLSGQASLDIGSVLRGIAKLHCTDRFDSWNMSNIVSESLNNKTNIKINEIKLIFWEIYLSNLYKVHLI